MRIRTIIESLTPLGQLALWGLALAGLTVAFQAVRACQELRCAADVIAACRAEGGIEQSKCNGIAVELCYPQEGQ